MTDAPGAGVASGTDAHGPRRRGRALGAVVLAAIAGAALAAIGAGMQWWSADYLDALTGQITVTLSGAACVPELVPLALVGLAGLGAALATSGLPRRLVGIVLLAAGATIAVRSALALGDPPAGLAGTLTRPAELVGAARLSPAGPVIAAVGGLLLALAGGLIIAGVGARPLGSRYERSKRSGTGRADAPTADGPGDPADWWKALDAGTDPTDAPPKTGAAGGGAVDPEILTHPGRGTAADTGSGDAASGRPVITGSHSVRGTNLATGTSAPGVENGAGSTGTVSEQTSRDGYHDPNAPPDLTGGAAGRGA